MKIPLSWIKDYVNIEIPIEDLAQRLTMAGLEVEEIRFVGLPLPTKTDQKWSSQHIHKQETKISGIEWEAEKIVVGAILEVMPHPNADRLVLCRLEDGQQEHIVLTGAPNLFPFSGKGNLAKPLKVAFAREGARIIDGHKPGQVLMNLKRTKIRGVESYSMACSEKELGISDEHEGIIILDDAAPTGMPLVEYMGDAVFDIAITPNIARNACVYGVAREIAALTGEELRPLDLEVAMEGPPIEGQAAIEIREAELNPRFVLGLIEDIQISESPYEIQRRLRLAGMRPINNVVDATNYVMLETGEPLHAFDYEVLMERTGGKPPTIITRTAKQGERLTTLDEVERHLDEFTTLVTDTAGALSIAGVMGGLESEVNDRTQRVLLEGAAWNFINIRKTISSQRISSEAAYRFSRGVHPAMAERGVRRGLKMLKDLCGGRVAQGLIDNYPLPASDPTVKIREADVERWLGISLPLQEIAKILKRLEFTVDLKDGYLNATTPDHRLDIGEGISGVADLMEEIARIYGYDLIPQTRMADRLPPQMKNRSLEMEFLIADKLVSLGLQEVITYRMTSPEREERMFINGSEEDRVPYIQLANPIVSDRMVMRKSLLASVIEVIERNARLQDRQAIFEIGPIYLSSESQELPDEPRRLVIMITGPRTLPTWQGYDQNHFDFHDLKGILYTMFEGLHLPGMHLEPEQNPSFHPGKCAKVLLGDQKIGVFGEIHPLVKERLEVNESPLLAADLDVEAIIANIPDSYHVKPVSVYPPVLEDLAIVVDEQLAAIRVEEIIQKAGGDMVTAIQLFDVYQGDTIGQGKKSLAYSITYQAPDRTLTDNEVARIRQQIIQLLKIEINASIRSLENN
jgi:phenylalanyl-tRNA synthetase beta chain